MSGDKVRGALLGGALGDALGAPVEMMSLAKIHATYGASGISTLQEAYGRVGAITDDTQMALFTAEAVIATRNRQVSYGISSFKGAVTGSYRRWLLTQGEELPHGISVKQQGVLWSSPEIHNRRFPGNTCIDALKTDVPGADRKGAGGIMRVAPIGLVLRPADAFKFAIDATKITHGHPSGYLAAAYFAALISHIREGTLLDDAIAACNELLVGNAHHEETLAAVNDAILKTEHLGVSPQAIESLGGGWVAEEALAIAIYCMMVCDTFTEALILSVNHSGDSDTTGSLVGALFGARDGESSLPIDWLDQLELTDVIRQVADALAAPPGDEDPDRYPYF